MSIQYLIPKPSVENAVNTGYKGTFLYHETVYNRDYYVLRQDLDNPWWAIGMIAKVGNYDHPIIVSDCKENVHTICKQGGGQSSGGYGIFYNGKNYYVSAYEPYATDTLAGSRLKDNIIPYDDKVFVDGAEGFRLAGQRLLELYIGAGGSLPTRDYLIPEPQEIIDGTSVRKIYQSGEKNWWCAAKLGERKYKWWAIGAIVTNTDGDNIPVIISNAEENCHLGSVSYSSDYGKYVFSVSSMSRTYYSFEQGGKTLYCSTSDYVAINDQELLSTVPILGGSYDMSDESVILSVAKTIVGNYVNAGGTIPPAETIETDDTYQKVEYTRINWENKSTSLKTPLNESNLNKMDKAIEELCRNLDIAHTESDVKKLDKTSANKLISETPTWDANTGILTFKFFDGTSFSVDFNIEKIPVSFSMDSAGVITMETADGTRWTADISKAIPSAYTFSNGARITFTETTGEDGTKKITADLVKGSITDEYLATDFLAKITSNVNSASSSAASAASSATDAAADAKLAQSYAIGGSGMRDGEDTDNAKYYAQKSAENLEYAKNLVTSGDDIAE